LSLISSPGKQLNGGRFYLLKPFNIISKLYIRHLHKKEWFNPCISAQTGQGGKDLFVLAPETKEKGERLQHVPGDVQRLKK
jgi:hypothetical protein